MKILVVSPVNFFPENADGTRKILFNIFRRLNHVHIDLICYEDTFVPNIKFEYNKTLSYVNVFQIRRTNKFDYSKVLEFPFSICKHDLFLILELLKVKLNESNYDKLLIITPFLSPIIEKIDEENRKKCILLSIDSMRLFLDRRIENDMLIKRIYDRWQKRLWEKCEEKFFPLFKKVIFVSNIDSNFSQSANLKNNFVVLPNGVDTDVFYPKKHLILHNRLVFSGNMHYQPTFEAAKFLIENIAVYLHDFKIKFNVCLVGLGSERLVPIANKYKFLDIDCLGYVDNLNDVLNDSLVYVSPLFLGSGIKNKVLEALAAGCPVVGSDISFDGIDGIVDGENAYIANTEEEFAMQIIKLLNNKDLQNKFRLRARTLIEEQYSWDRIAKQYQDILSK